ncbi:probable tubulin polyglutamylase TTLL9 isoform X3 [Mercenaria mercenaria]|uniref:probable tubulin polyglutamylase TTLL9 isoform X3 n=1 Tax=Mercenaria mercenaria TaxID=6596 RepID=UPI00234F77D1|nr:probable tubulin polyglutamylase TTLL9 isoform X3 [Mercenaria mercenaria]
MSKITRVPGYMQSKGNRNRGPIGDREIRYKCSMQNTILDVLRARPGWQEVSGPNTAANQQQPGQKGSATGSQPAKDKNGPATSSTGGTTTTKTSNQTTTPSNQMTGTTTTTKSSDGDWDFYWCDREWLHANYDTMFLQEHQKILHFRNHYELTRKNLMVKNLKRLRKQTEREMGKKEAESFDFFPTTYELPSEYHIFVEEFKKNPGIIWIMKPAAKSQGRGIFLFRKLKDITDWKKGEYQPLTDPNREVPETYVVQRYIENPYLIGGRKFDIRVYVLVVSYNPLKVWLYRSGFARFSNSRFSLDSIEDAYVHLTNVAVQKTAPDYDPDKGCKWATQQLRQYLTAKHSADAARKVFQGIDNIIIKSLQSVQKIIINDKHCFEMYGYDVLLDSKLKPWLIEINASPSLTASGKDDYDLKYGVLNDVLNVLDLENRLTGKEKRVGGFDLIWDDGPVLADDGSMECSVNGSSTTANSFLGCHSERKKQLREIYTAAQALKKSVAS